MRVVGGDHGDIEFTLETEQRLVYLLFLLEALILNFEIEVARPKMSWYCAAAVRAFSYSTGDQVFAELAAEAAREADEALGMFGEVTLADARLAVEAVERCLGRDTDEVSVAFFILGEHQQVIVVVAFAGRAVVFVFRDVELAAEDRLDAFFLRGLEEVHGAVDVAVVGHGDGLLAQRGNAVNEFLDVAGSVEEGVLGVQMEVGEFGHG